MATVQEVLAAAMMGERRGEIAQAEALYKFILARQPRNPDALHLLGMAAHQGGRHMEALALIQQAIAVNSGVTEYHEHLGVVLIALGRHEEAITSLRHTLGIDQKRPVTWIALGRAQMNLGRVPRALDSFKTALELDPENVD